jgi:DNA polymerase III subunit beta
LPSTPGFSSKCSTDSDEIRIELSTPTKAGIIKPTQQDEHEEVLMLVMPLMLNT